MQTIRIHNPNPLTVGNENRNAFVQGQVGGGWSGRPSGSVMVGGQIRF